MKNAHAETRRLQVPVAGMTCQACVGAVRGALQRVPGVAAAEVDLATRSATLALEPGAGPELFDALRRAVEPLGYRIPEGDLGARSLARDVEFGERAEREQRARERRDLVIAVALGVPTFLAEHLGAHPSVALALGAGVVFGAGGRILAHGLRALARRTPDMDTLVGLGALAAWTSALLAWVGPAGFAAGAEHLHAAVLVLAFVLLGRLLEGRVRSRAGDAVRALLDLAPPKARVVRARGEVEVPLADVRPGDVVRVRPGERVPVDGVVIEGRSSLDESLVTGESAPVERGPGERVLGGTANGEGALTLQAQGVGSGSRAARIAEAVQHAQSTRSSAQRLADRVSAVFVPVVLALSLLTLAGWLLAGAHAADAVVRAVAVLVVACPCALGLATPTAIVAASGRAAREGFLVRSADVFERLCAVRVVLFDKTGTLTEGRPALASVEVAGAGLDEAALLTLAAAVEERSEQPLARGIVAGARARGVQLPLARDVQADPGRGIRGTVRGRAVWLGSPRAAAERGLTGAAELAQRVAARGETPVLAEVDGALAGALGLRDRARATSAAAVRALAAEVGVEDARGELAPEDKLREIAERRGRGVPAAFVGDGLNDAPALSAAHAGIAITGGADAAVLAADAALLRPDPALVPRLVRLARATRSVVRQNLAWAFAYNLIALPAAAGVLEPWLGFAIPPGGAGAVMAASSVLVVANSLRLRAVRLD